MKNKLRISILALLTIILAACGGNEESASTNETNPENESHENRKMNKEGSNDHSSHEEMNHSGSSDIPESLEEAEDPAYPVGSQAMINAEHMPGMKGAEATISGAFNTTVYSVTYQPTTGGEAVENHKWVVHEEIENNDDEPFQPGDKVILDADHMEGMDNAEAVIETVEHTTVYMVDYTDTETGEQVTYHKWVTESELSPAD